MNKIPKNPAWCSCCRQPKDYGVCEHHINGQPYEGLDIYTGSAWVLSVVGQQYTGWGRILYDCVGYDPRHGFWMKRVDDGYETNVSERAIGVNYLPVRESSAAYVPNHYGVL